jgi:hypothetical protein
VYFFGGNIVAKRHMAEAKTSFCYKEQLRINRTHAHTHMHTQTRTQAHTYTLNLHTTAHTHTHTQHAHVTSHHTFLN